MCSDLSCSRYLRGLKETGLGARYEETLSLPDKVDRTLANLAAFLGRVLTP